MSRGAHDIVLNVLLFVPLGLMIGLAPGLRQRILLAVGALLTPFAIEAAQLLLPVLARGCQSADVADNVLGLVLGLTTGIVLRRI